MTDKQIHTHHLTTDRHQQILVLVGTAIKILYKIDQLCYNIRWPVLMVCVFPSTTVVHAWVTQNDASRVAYRKIRTRVQTPCELKKLLSASDSFTTIAKQWADDPFQISHASLWLAYSRYLQPWLGCFKKHSNFLPRFSTFLKIVNHSTTKSTVFKHQ